MNRRRFLCSAAATAALSALSEMLHAQGNTNVTARLTIQPDRPVQAIAKNFLGLSYETAQLSHPDFFSAGNTGLAGFLRPLGQGVLRIGGNSSEYAFWTPHPSQNPAQPPSPTPRDAGHRAPTPTQTTPKAIRNLRQFLDMVDWRAMYGLNFGKGTPRMAAEEAAFVYDTLGDRLISFQIGNEDDLFSHNGLRPSGYSYADFAIEWKTFYDAVKGRVPKAKFAGPDTAGTSNWLVEFAQQFGKNVVELSTHYYALGPASDPAMNIERLLSPHNSRWESGVPKIRQAMAESHLPYRLTETNSCYGGGKPGVSNTFASTLWALDLMFQLLMIGGCGINFHGGGYGWYSPIVGTIENGFVARPEYYALLAMAQLLGGQMVASKLDAADAGPLFVAYATQDAKRRLRAVAINKDSEKNVRLTLQTNSAGERVSLQRLIAPTLEDEQDTTFAGSPVGAEGSFRPTQIEHVPIANGAAECTIPAGSAALLTWE